MKISGLRNHQKMMISGHRNRQKIKVSGPESIIMALVFFRQNGTISGTRNRQYDQENLYGSWCQPPPTTPTPPPTNFPCWIIKATHFVKYFLNILVLTNVGF